MINRLSGAAVAAALLLSPALASATPLLGSPTKSATFAATIGNVGGALIPWTGEVFVTVGECLRIAVTTQSADLLLTAISPSGEVYRDDSTGGSTKPLIRINQVNVEGYYSVQATQHVGTAVDATFTIKLERLPVNSSACLPETIPMKQP